MRQHFTPTRITKIRQRGQIGGEIGALIHCWWECKVGQLAWNTVGKLLQELNLEILFHNLVISFKFICKRIENIGPCKNSNMIPVCCSSYKKLSICHSILKINKKLKNQQLFSVFKISKHTKLSVAPTIKEPGRQIYSKDL